MMILGIRGLCDTIDKGNAVGEGSEGICLSESVTAPCPAVQLAEGTLYLEIGELGAHGAIVS